MGLDDTLAKSILNINVLLAPKYYLISAQNGVQESECKQKLKKKKDKTTACR